jgi:ribosomal protein L12E/L44/L45/RPP1/RPP2
MPDDEPLDDVISVGTAAAAAAARVTESVARHVSETKARERAALERVQDQQRARQTLGNVEQKVAPKVDQAYDSTEQRGKRDAIREEAGVPLENRRVVATADQMNGRDPKLASLAGTMRATKARAPMQVPEQQRGR